MCPLITASAMNDCSLPVRLALLKGIRNFSTSASLPRVEPLVIPEFDGFCHEVTALVEFLRCDISPLSHNGNPRCAVVAEPLQCCCHEVRSDSPSSGLGADRKESDFAGARFRIFSEVAGNVTHREAV